MADHEALLDGEDRLSFTDSATDSVQALSSHRISERSSLIESRERLDSAPRESYSSEFSSGEQDETVCCEIRTCAQYIGFIACFAVIFGIAFWAMQQAWRSIPRTAGKFRGSQRSAVTARLAAKLGRPKLDIGFDAESSSRGSAQIRAIPMGNVTFGNVHPPMLDLFHKDEISYFAAVEKHSSSATGGAPEMDSRRIVPRYGDELAVTEGEAVFDLRDSKNLPFPFHAVISSGAGSKQDAGNLNTASKPGESENVSDNFSGDRNQNSTRLAVSSVPRKPGEQMLSGNTAINKLVESDFVNCWGGKDCPLLSRPGGIGGGSKPDVAGVR